MELVVRSSRRSQATEKNDIYDSHNPLAEICLTTDTGLGLLALTDIERGTRIISETPLIILRSAECKASQLWKHLGQLTPQQLDRFDSLSGSESFANKTNRRRIHNSLVAVEERKAIQDGDAMELVKGRVEVELKRFTIWKTNAITLGTTQTRHGIFPLSARINHSCAPNVVATYSQALDKLVVHATRDIKAGSDLVAAYINPAQSRSMRDMVLKSHKFTCRCELCASSKSSRGEILRNMVEERDRALQTFEWNIGGALPLPGQIIPKNYKEALQLAEHVVSDLKEARLVDMNLAAAFHRCSKYALQLNMLEKAKSFAQKQQEVEVCCRGDADQEWMAHLLEAETKEKVQKSPSKRSARKQGKRSGGKRSGRKGGNH